MEQQITGEIVEKDYDMLTDDGRRLVKAFLETDTPLSVMDLEERTGLKREELMHALIDAKRIIGEDKDNEGRYVIPEYFRPHLQRIAK